jgi:outer membrane protein assembly factor BamB
VPFTIIWKPIMKQKIRGSLVFHGLLIFTCSILGNSPLFSEDWPQFRGPNCSGVSSSKLPLPVEFSHEKNVQWSVKLGDGISSPVVANGRLFITAMAESNRFSMYCFDAASGQLIWEQSFDTGPLPTITPPNSAASSTPVTDGEHVFTYFSTLGLIGMDWDGRVLWKHKLPIPQYLLDWGAAASPIVYKDLVIFNQDDDLNPFLLGLDKFTGKVRWKTEREDMLAGYAVPVLCTANGRTDVVIAGSGKLKGYNPETGEEQWTCNTLLRTIMTTPVVHNDTIYITVQSYGDTDRVLKYALLQWKDTNQDGKLDPSEVPDSFGTKFKRGDINQDGFLVDDEIDAAFQSPDNMVGGGNVVQAVRGGGSGDVTDTHLLWQRPAKTRAPSNLSSPLVVHERLFVVKRGGISSCFNANTGEQHWYLKRIRNLGEYYASPVAGDGKIYVTGENGFVMVLADEPNLRILAKNDMGDTCIATPAIADGRLFFRTKTALLCVSE